MAIVLASGSPRRRELMEMLGAAELRIIPAKGEEISVPGRSARETVLALSRAKAEEVAALCEAKDVIIAADTVVALGSDILGKPADERDAARMLRALSGREHHVFTGVTVIAGRDTLCECDETAVRFRALTDAEIDAYIRTGEPMDKAGAYAAQGRAALFIEGMDGDFFNVMGLPVCLLGKMLKKIGVELL